MSAALQALREYASAIRGDWGDIDGRSLKIELDDLADAIEGKGSVGWDIEKWRQDLSLCPSGDGHWTCHCQPVQTIGEGEDTHTWGCGNEPSSW